METTLTIGMAHHSDFSGAYFSVQDIRKELMFNRRAMLLGKIEFLIIENDPDGAHAKHVQGLSNHDRKNIRVVNFDTVRGTSATRNKIIEEAKGDFVLVMDCHVLLCPVVSTIDTLFRFMQYNKKSNDLFTGPLVHDNLTGLSTHFNDSWGGQMWGQWGRAWRCVCESYNFSVMNNNKKSKFVDLASQEEIKNCKYCDRAFPEDIKFSEHQGYLSSEGYGITPVDSFAEPFEVFAQGLGLFFTRKNAWLGFNEHSRGFGGEECYIHEKYRQAGRKTICLPFLRWLHRFGRPDGIKYELTVDNKVRNYVFEFMELGLDFKPLRHHFITENNFSEDKFNEFVREAESVYADDNVYNSSDGDILKQIEDLKSQLSKPAKQKKSCCKNRKGIPVR